jgi:predicted MFS family arabinose efflux permease
VSFQAVLIGASLLLFFSDSPAGFLPAMVLLGTSAGFTYFSSIYYSLNTGENRGARSGIHEALIGSGIVAGPLTGGMVAQTWGLRSPYLLSTLVVIGSLGALGLRANRGGRTRANPETIQNDGCNL